MHVRTRAALALALATSTLFASSVGCSSADDGTPGGDDVDAGLPAPNGADDDGGEPIDSKPKPRPDGSVPSKDAGTDPTSTPDAAGVDAARGDASDGAPPATPDASPIGTTVSLFGVGDIASCSSTMDDKTAALLDGTDGPVVLLGDNAYETGSATEYTQCFQPSWGRHKSRLKPSPGNHEYLSINAGPYYQYFGAAAGDPSKGYYSFERGDWHIIAINSNCGSVGGCQAGSPQEKWLKTDLAAHPTKCALAFWHHPRFSSGEHGNDAEMMPIWQTLYDANVDIVLSGHDHNYERFAPQKPNGAADPARGIREFVVGTGGRDLRTIGAGVANSEVRNADSYGVLKLDLSPNGYAWTFLAAAGSTLTDTGTATCH